MTYLTYPKLTFKKASPQASEKSRWTAFHESAKLGEVYSLYTGGWGVVKGLTGYATRYEAAYSLYIRRERQKS